MGQFTHATSYVSKAEQTPDALDTITVAKLRCVAGLADLESKKFKLASPKFLETCRELGSQYDEELETSDGCCQMGSEFDRDCQVIAAKSKSHQV
ncbi:hypothetical protein SAY86_012182 [Trapa natans]|uniref:26S proteasome regulatory subunit Rpn7 N-terminal domain-containing protein n=1 Tax=Trapa natans TaxID=22666 RepID=A0AAN7LRQ8_TRANT|nr:hypothetical protein SAY86_012182 [Trapa natans]